MNRRVEPESKVISEKAPLQCQASVHPGSRTGRLLWPREERPRRRGLLACRRTRLTLALPRRRLAQLGQSACCLLRQPSFEIELLQFKCNCIFSFERSACSTEPRSCVMSGMAELRGPLKPRWMASTHRSAR